MISGAPNSLMTVFANASTAFVDSTSSLAVFVAFRPLSLSVATSVAMTLAPSSMKASAIARPMPWPAAVTSASLFFSRSVISISSSFRTPRKRRSGIQKHIHRPVLDSRFALRAPRNDKNLMIVARDAVLGDALILHGRLQHHAVRELVNHGALDFLPWCLARRV